MGMELDNTSNLLDERITIDIERMRLLGLHLVEYADRHGVDKKELKDMLRMIGL